MMTSLKTSWHDDKISLLYWCLDKIAYFTRYIKHCLAYDILGLHTNVLRLRNLVGKQVRASIKSSKSRKLNWLLTYHTYLFVNLLTKSSLGTDIFCQFWKFRKFPAKAKEHSLNADSWSMPRNLCIWKIFTPFYYPPKFQRNLASIFVWWFVGLPACLSVVFTITQ